MDEKKKEVKKDDVVEVKKEEKVQKEVKEEKRKGAKGEEKTKTEVVKDIKGEEKPKNEKKSETSKVETKKFEVKNDKAKKLGDKNKKTSWVVTVITILAVLVVVVLLTYMIVTSSDPKKSVDGLLTNLRAGDFEKAQEFISGDDLLDNDEFSVETKKLLFDKLAWKVTKVTQENDTATVEIEVTNKDFKTIISNYMQKALKAAFAGENISEQEIDNYFTEELKNEQVQTTTVTKTIQVIKEDKKWKVVSNDELADALLPGLQETVNSLY